MKPIYKIGDKVKIVKSDDFSDLVGKVCEVSELTNPSSSFACRIIYRPTSWNSLMFAWEIEKVSEKGKQLLFSFMK